VILINNRNKQQNNKQQMLKLNRMNRKMAAAQARALKFNSSSKKGPTQQKML
jgi:hypothetical protein